MALLKQEQLTEIARLSYKNIFLKCFHLRQQIYVSANGE